MTNVKIRKTKNIAPSIRKWLHSLLIMPAGIDLWIQLAMFGLMIFGTVMVGSASMGISTGDNRYLAITIVKQIVFVTAGYVLMTLLANSFDLKFLKSKRFPSLVFVTCGLLLACLGFRATGNAHAWLRFGFGGVEVTIQPSEFAKIVAILTVAAYCGDVKKTYSNWWQMCRVPIGLTFVMFAITLILQDDFGSALVIFLVTNVCFLIPRHPNMHRFQIVLKILFWLAVLFSIYLLSPRGEHLIQGMNFLQDYQKNRFLTAINPFADQYGTGYQLINGLVAFATGGWFGVGFGGSVRKYTRFPAANTDYILSIVVEELGYVGFLFLMVLYCVVIFRLFRHARKIRSERAKIILIGTATYLLVHMFFNIGGVTGLVPLTGIPLLMISAGGSSTMSFMMAVGISQAIISGHQRGLIR